jgi:putative endonuclease
VTDNLIRRIQEHKADINDGFTKKYKVHQLVWYSIFGNIYDAIATEKRIKKWKREYKINTIEMDNPEWRDIYDEIIQ